MNSLPLGTGFNLPPLAEEGPEQGRDGKLGARPSPGVHAILGHSSSDLDEKPSLSTLFPHLPQSLSQFSGAKSQRQSVCLPPTTS